MWSLAHRFSKQIPSTINHFSLRSTLQRLALRTYSEKSNNQDDKSIVNQETKTIDKIDFINNKSDDSLQPLSEMDQLMEGFQDKKEEVDFMKTVPVQVFFTDEQKALMQKKDQKIPYTVETKPGLYCYENSVRPMVSFPDPTLTNLDSHEDFKEYSLGWPVIRPPCIRDRIVEGLKFSRTTSARYPWIQEFRSHYDFVIVGGGIVGSCIANFLAERIKVQDGFRIAVIEKDPTYRKCLSTQFLGSLRTQFSSPELVEAALFSSDFLRLSSIQKTVPHDQNEFEGFFNIPSLKFQPHGNLTLVRENNLENLKQSHHIQSLCGAQNAMLTKSNLEKRFKWLNTSDLAGGCLGLESEGWFDTWNFLQSLIVRNKYLGVEYIHGEMMFSKKHNYDTRGGRDTQRNFEAHIFVGETKHVYPIEFSQMFIAAAGQSGNIGRMCGIGTGRGVMYMDIPVEPKRGYIYRVRAIDPPGLNFPTIADPSGLFVRRDGLLGHFIVGLLPNDDPYDKVPEGITGGVEPEYFDREIRPILEHRIPSFKECSVLESKIVEYDLNYTDGTPIIGRHPLHTNIFIATGFNGRGAMFGPAAGRGIAELTLDDGYKTIDFSRFSFDRFFEGLETKEFLYC